MDIGVIASRYAKTLLKFATENKEEDAVYEEMHSLSQAFLAQPVLQPTLNNPVVTDQQKIDVLQAAIGGEHACSLSTSKFFELVVGNRRTEQMVFIANAYMSAYLKAKNIVRGKLTLAAPVSESTQERLKKVVEEKVRTNLLFETAIDPDLKGGFILQYDTYRYDASLKAQLARLQRELS
ncbi:MAG: F0F1 ATP synthase subunit delta [Alloprevotella sp.]|nr:F0F1 ATP synthase subunit delta [Alloprevotella sp.]